MTSSRCERGAATCPCRPERQTETCPCRRISVTMGATMIGPPFARCGGPFAVSGPYTDQDTGGGRNLPNDPGLRAFANRGRGVTAALGARPGASGRPRRRPRTTKGARSTTGRPSQLIWLAWPAAGWCCTGGTNPGAGYGGVAARIPLRGASRLPNGRTPPGSRRNCHSTSDHLLSLVAQIQAHASGEYRRRGRKPDPPFRRLPGGIGARQSGSSARPRG